MKIGVISDTHVSKNFNKLEELLNKYLKDVDMIIHAGDFKESTVLDKIKEFKPTVAVYGNVDDEHLKNNLKETELIKVGKYKIGITHGHGKNKSTIERAYDIFKDKSVDIIIFGHSHIPIIRSYKNILMINPGSITSKRKEKHYSFIIITLDEEISVELKLVN